MDQELNNNLNLPYLFNPPPPPIPLPPLQNPNTSLDFDWVNLLGVDGGSFMTGSDRILQPPVNGGGGDRQVESCGKVGSRGKNGRGKKSVPPRVAFHTKSSEDVLDDGYRWRKYGQKAVKNSKHPRSYYRCTHHTCNVKKQIQRLSKDTSIVVTTYEGIHNHPCEKLMETLGPLLKQIQFLSRF
ncbi:hypothetical protein NMG60_11030481 [Bertholletia excelsa]